MSETKWTPAEDKLLLQLADEGKTYAAIAEIMGRSKGGVRNRLSRVRNPEQTGHRIIIHNMSADEFGELLRAKERAADAKRAEAFAAATLDDYTRLYKMCESLLKAYKNHRNTKAAFDALEAELAEHIPCPF
jgi:ParB-like chromosome segregation protein Spo0J